jgi:hypothetical protein
MVCALAYARLETTPVDKAIFLAFAKLWRLEHNPTDYFIGLGAEVALYD